MCIARRDAQSPKPPPACYRQGAEPAAAPNPPPPRRGPRGVRVRPHAARGRFRARWERPTPTRERERETASSTPNTQRPLCRREVETAVPWSRLPAGRGGIPRAQPAHGLTCRPRSKNQRRLIAFVFFRAWLPTRPHHPTHTPAAHRLAAALPCPPFAFLGRRFISRERGRDAVPHMRALMSLRKAPFVIPFHRKKRVVKRGGGGGWPFLFVSENSRGWPFRAEKLLPCSLVLFIVYRSL